MNRICGNSIRGRVRPHVVQGEIWTPTRDFRHNMVLYQWATLASKLLTLGESSYRIAGMYLEFENTANPGDPVTVPVFDRTRTVDYYNSLSGSSDRDYLRVPLTASQLFSAGEGLTDNQMVFFARSQGVVGVHGKPFSFAANSVVFGGSLVAYVDATDETRDLLFSSFYFDEADQQQKLSTSQIGIEWELTLE